MNFPCSYCGKEFKHKQSVYKHEKSFHLSITAGCVICPISQCNMGLNSYKSLRNHLANIHDTNIEKVELTFQSFEEFKEWKSAEEKTSLCSYFISSTTEQKQGKKTYFHCHRSGKFLSKSKMLRAPKSKGSCRTGVNCPSTIEVLQLNDCVNVTFFPMHIGHEKDTCHLRVNQSFKTKISEEEEAKIISRISAIDEELAQIHRAIHRLETKKRTLETEKENLKQNQQKCLSEKLANLNWERTDHVWSKKAEATLKDVFKLFSFRPHQLSAINAVMSKQDCILLMPTGGGKSLCYQLPAMLSSGVTLVVSPLLSLMEDQIMSLESLDVPAAMLNASSTREHVNEVQKAMTDKSSKLKLLYVTPEKLAKSKRFMAKLEKMYQVGNFSLLAIDEVHCCSQWGNDFRPDYKFLGIMKRQFPNVPILGLTATATSRVVTDVQKILNIESSLVLKASFNRPNLHYEVRHSSQKDSIDDIEKLLKGKFCGLSGIIYCFSIKEAEEIADKLRTRGIGARSYHAQLDAKVRSSVHRLWVNNSIQVVVATVAFGMGIDKPDVRFVIHNSLAKSMENFYQESGRAGRDDQLAHCILFFRFPDMFRQSTMVFTEQTGLENLYSMIAYCLDISRCRRAIIAEHFGERWESGDCKAMCDHCASTSPYHEVDKDVTQHCLTLYNIIEYCSMKEERLTAQKLIDAWTGKGPPKLRPPDHKSTPLTRQSCERILALLLLEGCLKEEFHFTPYSTISYINTGPKYHAVKGGKLIVTLPLPSIQPKVMPSPNVPPPPKKFKTSLEVKRTPNSRNGKSQDLKKVSKTHHSPISNLISLHSDGKDEDTVLTDSDEDIPEFVRKTKQKATVVTLSDSD